MVTLHEVITFLVSMQISISSLQTHNVNRCGRSRHLARKLSLRRKRSSPRSEERFSRNAETEIVCRLLLEKKNTKQAVRDIIVTVIYVVVLGMQIVLWSQWQKRGKKRDEAE